MDMAKFKLTSSAPLLMHNGRLSNPFDPFAVAMKEITAKKKKTEEDCQVLYWLEWVGGLYTEKPILPSDAGKMVTRPIIPEANLLSFINDGARHFRRGQDVLRGVQIVGTPLLEDTGWPERKGLQEIHTLGTFTDVRTIVNPSTGGRSQRCRPIFRQWSVTFEVAFDTEILSTSDIVSWVDRAARYNGLCDGKPLFGRCASQVIGAKEAAA